MFLSSFVVLLFFSCLAIFVSTLSIKMSCGVVSSNLLALEFVFCCVI